MKIERIEIRKIFLPFIKPFTTSGWTENGNHSVIVRIDMKGLTGWGEAPVGLMPFYNEETAGTAWVIMKEILIPMIRKVEFKDETKPQEIYEVFAPVRGNKIAVTGLEFAVWDLLGKIQNKSISKMLGGIRKNIDVGVSVGIQKNISSILSLVDNYLAEGYKRIKIKIKPGWDIDPVKEIRKKWENLFLQVDANSAYTLNDLKHLSKLDNYNLLLIEQPLAHDDLYEHSRLQKKIKTPICLDESIISPLRAKNAIEMKACKIINIKPSRVGGLTAAKIIHNIAENNRIPVWCGGMLETGIGRAFNVALASLNNFILPGDISASKRYFNKDIVLNPFQLNPDGTLTVPDKPGSGVQVDEKFLEEVTLEKEIYRM
jgi:o-succinylbenzoate synthase